MYVCNPILGEYIIVPVTNNGRHWGSFVALGFSVGANECKVLQTFYPLIELHSRTEYLEAEVYTIGTGGWRGIGNVPYCLAQFVSFNAFLHGAQHWLDNSYGGSDFIHSLYFEREQFQTLPPPSCFGELEKKFKECQKLGVLQDCLFLCVFGDDMGKFD